MTVYLEGIAAQFYRGIGSDAQIIAPFSRVNFFVGENNSGKSIILNLISAYLRHLSSGGGEFKLTGPEIHRAKKTGEPLIAIGKNKDRLLEDFSAFFGWHNQAASLKVDASKIVDCLSIQNNIWVSRENIKSYKIFPENNIAELKKLDVDWYRLWQVLIRATGGNANDHWIPETVDKLLSCLNISLPNVYLLPAKRILGSKGESLDDLSGRGLIDHLASLQNPAWNRQEDREKFQRINNFLREVTGKGDAILEVPSEREHLIVHMDDKVLPLSSLGTGVHEVVLIASFCTIYDKSIMCLEEPEIHLHPLLQRKLVNYLINSTESQYFIATHSASFIDTPGSNVFHVTNDGEQTRIKAVLTKNEQRALVDDLGYQASDILQANAVIWVEGPSDRIYLNHWLSAFDDRLKEGIHYTIMFYGGSLIKHLAASDDALESFIKLRDLNRNMAIVIDSDREFEGTPLKPHAQRISGEMSNGPGVVWVTSGREVENYVDHKVIQSVLKEIHPRLYDSPGPAGAFDHAFYFYKRDGSKRVMYKDGDKVGAANLVCEQAADLDRLDLRERIEELAAMICKANGLERS